MHDEKETRDGFIFYRSFLESLKDLPADIFKLCVVALCDYAFDGVYSIPENEPYVKLFFNMAKPQIDANYKRYMNGKTGGAPKGNQNAVKDKSTKNNQKQPKDKDKDNDKDNDKGKGKEKEQAQANDNNNAGANVNDKGGADSTSNNLANDNSGTGMTYRFRFADDLPLTPIGDILGNSKYQ